MIDGYKLMLAEVDLTIVFIAFLIIHPQRNMLLSNKVQKNKKKTHTQ